MFANQFELGEVLGHGRYGDVWSARDITIHGGASECPIPDFPLAIKVYNALDEIRFFQNEVKILTKIGSTSPDIIKFHGGGAWVDVSTPYPRLKPYVVFSRYSSPLSAIIENAPGSMPLEHLRSIARCIFRGLAALHALNIIHTDIKPENILMDVGVDGLPTAVLGDLGSAVASGEFMSDCVGTVSHLAPEVILHRPWGTPYDVWCAHIVCFEMFSGMIPFDVYGDYDAHYGEDVDGEAMEDLEPSSGSGETYGNDALTYRHLLLIVKVLGPVPHELTRRARQFLTADGFPVDHPSIVPVGLEGLLAANSARSTEEISSAATFLAGGITWLPADRPTIEACLAHKWLAEN